MNGADDIIISGLTLTGPRMHGAIFGFANKGLHFHNLRLADLIECIGTPRPLFRNDASGAALVENNTLLNVSDPQRYSNKPTGAEIGLEQPLKFTCGVNGEKTVDGWN